MPKASEKADPRTVKDLLSELDTLLTSSPTELPEGRSQRAHELLSAAIKLTESLIATPPPPARLLGQRGGMKTAKRGPDYFRKIAGMRKTKGGGRPRKAE